MQESERQALEDDLRLAMEKEDMLLNELMQKERTIDFNDQLQDKHRKEKQKIQTSRTWKLTAPFRKLMPRYRKRIKEQEHYISALELELQETKRDLRVIEERLQVETEKRNSSALFRMLRQAKASGDMMRHLEQMIHVKNENKAHFTNAFKYIANLYKAEEPDYRNMIYKKIMSGMTPDEIPEVIVRGAMDETPVDLGQAASFRHRLTLRQRQNQLTGPLPEWYLEHKEASFELMDSLNVKRPWTSGAVYGRTDIPEQEKVVIKPRHGAGSRGVYLVHDFHDIMDIKRTKVLHDRQELTENMAKDIESGWVQHDEWMLEELIYEDALHKIPARDIKCYCFYGEVALILEIIRSPELKYCWWTADGRRIRTGKYDDDLFKGEGLSQEEIDQAADISKHIPAPFIRIDFLKGEDGLVFGEFTPKPGNYDAFDSVTDKWLGDHFLQAETRLMNDLMAGKAFTTYKDWLSEWEDKTD